MSPLAGSTEPIVLLRLCWRLAMARVGSCDDLPLDRLARLDGRCGQMRVRRAGKLQHGIAHQERAGHPAHLVVVDMVVAIDARP